MVRRRIARFVPFNSAGGVTEGTPDGQPLASLVPGAIDMITGGRCLFTVPDRGPGILVTLLQSRK